MDFFSRINVSTGPNFIVWGLTDDGYRIGMFCPQKGDFLYIRELPLVSSDYVSFNDNFNSVLALGRETGTIIAMRADDGEEIARSRCKGAESVVSLSADFWRVSYRKELKICDYGGVCHERISIPGPVAYDWQRFLLILNKSEDGFLILNQNYDCILEENFTGLGITSARYADWGKSKYCCICESRGNISLIDLSSGTLCFSIRPPDGYNPISCGIDFQSKKVIVQHAFVKTMRRSIIASYDILDGTVISSVEMNSCPSAEYSPSLRGFITSRKELISLGDGCQLNVSQLRVH